jgi:filamentous hemagglutinin
LFEVIYGANGSKAVRVQYKNSVSGDDLVANIPYNERGLPIFDDVSAFTTNIDKNRSYTSQMTQATRDLKRQINLGNVSAELFTAKQLKNIQSGRPKIPDYTWHHNPINNSMQLVPFKVHDAVKHIGERALTEGR